MSIVPKETIEVISQSMGINNLSPAAALALAPDVEYRMREIMQEAIKCMRHSKRTTLTADDVDGALNLRNVEPIYGFAAGGPLQFKRALGHRDLYYIDDKDRDFKDVIDAPLPKAPLDTAVYCHWLAIDGVQPSIPENAVVEVIRPPSDNKNDDQKDGSHIDLRLPVKHVLSRELQLYFQKITELTVSKSNLGLFKEALVSLATDPGLHTLVPYFTNFIADEVSRGLSDFLLLFNLMRLVGSLLQNPHIHIESYLHQLMPSVVTCLVSRKLGNRIADNHWELRDFTAHLVALICKRYEHIYNTLQTRLTKTLLSALLDPKKSLTQHYGAIQGLTALGPNVIRLYILPNLEPYIRALEPDLSLEKQKNEMKRHEAWRVYGALLRAAGQCVYDRLKIFPSLRSPPPGDIWRRNGKVLTSREPKKRKANMESHEEEPPHKKIATNEPTSDGSNKSSPSPVQAEAVAPAQSGNSDAGPPSSSEQRPDESLKRNGKSNDKSPALKRSAIINQVWKDDLDSGNLLVSLFDLFGERIFPFIPTPEMSLFV